MNWEENVMKGEQMSEEIQAKTKKWGICNPAFIEDICHITAEAQRDADVEWFNSEYPIKYREEADEVGHFIDRGWIPPEQYKINIQQAKAEVAREIRFQILEWFRNYAHQLDRKFPHPTTEEQGWLGNIWDMIHMAGKEDFGNEFLKEAA